MARRDQTLYRDPDDQMIGGVCSGLGRYFDIDTNIVRVAFVVLTVLGGGGIIGYGILWAVLDQAPAGYWTAPALDADPAAPPVIDDTEVIDVTNAAKVNEVNEVARPAHRETGRT